MSKTLSMHPAITADITKPITLDFTKPFVPQVRSYFERLEDIREYNVTGLPGQAVGAVLTLPVLEMTKGLPKMALFGFGKEIKVLGELDLSDFRHNTVRPRRNEVPDGDAYPGYTILDGAGRGVESYQLEEIAAALKTTVDNIRVVDVNMGHINPANPVNGKVGEQEVNLIDRLIGSGLTKADWVSGRLLFLPPGFGPLAIVMVSAIYGLTEVWPKTIRLNREDDGTFHLAEIVDPQPMRQFGVQLRAKWEKGQAPIPVPRDLFDQIHSVLVNAGEEELADKLAALAK